jgi:hypothetical protein
MAVSDLTGDAAAEEEHIDREEYECVDEPDRGYDEVEKAPFHRVHLTSAHYLRLALTCDDVCLLRARRPQVQRLVRQGALSLGGPPWLCRTAAAQSVLHRQV